MKKQTSLFFIIVPQYRYCEFFYKFKIKKILHFISCLYIKSKRPLFKATQAKSQIKFNYEEEYLFLQLLFVIYLFL